MKKAALALEDGTFLQGLSFGAEGERAGELVFNTSLTGYQEILTDPSYKGQIVMMTYPQIGNYGITAEDMESRGLFLDGFVVREASKTFSNFQAVESLQAFLTRHNVPGIEGVDTRALTRHIRDKGAMRCVLSTSDLDRKSLVRKALAAPKMAGLDLARQVECAERYDWAATEDRPARFHVAVLDFGVKYSILRCLARTCKVTVFPGTASADDILRLAPDGVVLSNGPGDPAAVRSGIETTKRLLDKGVPLFGICLGHQLLGLALGGRTFKLKFGHHGSNHPVQDLDTGRIEITSQNHGFCVDIESLPRSVRTTHRNLNDGTSEGLAHAELPALSVQYHPEAGAGPHDSRYLFDRFADLMSRRRSKEKAAAAL